MGIIYWLTRNLFLEALFDWVVVTGGVFAYTLITKDSSYLWLSLVALIPLFIASIFSPSYYGRR